MVICPRIVLVVLISILISITKTIVLVYKSKKALVVIIS